MCRMSSLAAAPDCNPDAWLKQTSTCLPVSTWTNFTKGTLAFPITVTSRTSMANKGDVNTEKVAPRGGGQVNEN